jgi:hypothetical protein
MYQISTRFGTHIMLAVVITKNYISTRLGTHILQLKGSSHLPNM